MIFCTGLSVPEGPVLLSDGSFLVVEMGPERGSVTHVSPDGKDKRIIAKTGRPNGLAVDRHGAIWVAESANPASLLRVTMDGKIEVFVTECKGEPFLFPNDLAIGPEGDIYLTDSGILIKDFAPGGNVRPDWATCPMDGRVFQINPKTRKVTKIDTGLKFTNGIAFGPDQNLYVNEMIPADIWRYEWKDGKIVSGRQFYGNVADPASPATMKFPDGHKFGANGHLYVAVFGQGDVTVLGPDGKVTRRIKTEGDKPTNCVFGPAGTKKLYVTEDERGTMEVFDVGTDGLPLYL
jgi:gluconolactonase